MMRLINSAISWIFDLGRNGFIMMLVFQIGKELLSDTAEGIIAKGKKVLKYFYRVSKKRCKKLVKWLEEEKIYNRVAVTCIACLLICACFVPKVSHSSMYLDSIEMVDEEIAEYREMIERLQEICATDLKKCDLIKKDFEAAGLPIHKG